jgi:hypothetical protein
VALLYQFSSSSGAGLHSVDIFNPGHTCNTAGLANPYESYPLQYGRLVVEGENGQGQHVPTTGAIYPYPYYGHGYSTLQHSYFPVNAHSDFQALSQPIQPAMILQSNSHTIHHTNERNSIATSTLSQHSGSTQYESSRKASEYSDSEPPPRRKRSRNEDEYTDKTQETHMYNTNLTLDLPVQARTATQHSPNHASPFQFQPPQLPLASSSEKSPRSEPRQLHLQQPFVSSQVSQTTQHHHHLPKESPTPKHTKHNEETDLGPPNMVGQEGMPEPAARPRGPKLKFTREDDALLVRLKESKNLTWKQISDFFPGRSAGTLQVRYCTKLKAKTTMWNDDMVSPKLFFFFSFLF